MKIKKIVATFLFMMFSGVSMSSEIEYIVDIGHIEVSMAEKDTEVTFQRPESCPDSDLEIRKSGKTIYVKHVGAKCNQGFKIKLPVVYGQSCVIKLNAGVVTLPDEKNVVNDFSKVDLLVNAGRINLSYMPLRLINFSSGQKANASFVNSSKAKFSLKLGSGIINSK